MTDRDAIPGPLDALVKAVAGRPVDDDQRASTFARGLALGALVGAAIAGSTIWQRRHTGPRPAPRPAVRRPDDSAD
jgi:hypothetical protein